MKITASIVIYNEKKDTLKGVLDSFETLDYEKELVVVDNSTESLLKSFCESYRDVKYVFSGKNIGFGAGHNLAFKHVSLNSDLHMIVNPDVYFYKEEMTNFLDWLVNSIDISLATPMVRNTDGSVQNVVRNIPTPISLLKRKLGIESGEIEVKDKDIVDIPFAHGCFMVFKTDFFEKLGGFDDGFFMYMEDVDIFIRSKKYGRTVINTNFSIYHEHRKGSSKSMKLLFHHIISAVKYFIKSY
jgi:GT2 family glycosyltransferase